MIYDIMYYILSFHILFIRNICSSVEFIIQYIIVQFLDSY